MAEKPNKLKMKRTPCSTDNSILGNELEQAVRHQTVKKIVVAETPNGFFVVSRFTWAENKDWYLTTRRERRKPRLFKDLQRLNEYLKEYYPTDSIEILRNQEIPEQEELLNQDE